MPVRTSPRKRIAAEALRDAATNYETPPDLGGPSYDADIPDWLRTRAGTIEASEPPSRSGLELDADTAAKGVEGPFDSWEHDNTGLVHVLWAAKHDGLDLIDNADEIATRVMHSRWLAAQRADAVERGAKRV